MIATGFTTVGMLVCLAAAAGIIIYAARRGLKIDDGNHKALWVGLWSALVTTLIIGGMHIWLVSQN
jgi:predicted tellurium resistance membrane protein TerC